jgi:ABC-type protease/lipase transport system fused ATPase/permease subunit
MLRIWRTSSSATRPRLAASLRPFTPVFHDTHSKLFSTLPDGDTRKGKPGVWAVMQDILSAGKRDKAAVAAPNALGNKEALKRVLGLMKPELRPLTLAVGSLGVTTAISLVFPAAVGQILDYSLAPTATMSPITIAVGMFGLFAVQTVFMGTRTTLLANMGERIVNRLRKCVTRANVLTCCRC